MSDETFTTVREEYVGGFHVELKKNLENGKWYIMMRNMQTFQSFMAGCYLSESNSSDENEMFNRLVNTLVQEIENPLFIPLKKEYFENFKDGTRSEVYQMYGKKWNHDTCYRGRPVILSLGCGKQRRLSGVITMVRSIDREELQELPSRKDCYKDKKGFCIAIEIKQIRPIKMEDKG